MNKEWVDDFDPNNPPRMWSMGHFILDRDAMEAAVDRKLTNDEWLEFVFITQKAMEMAFEELNGSFASYIKGSPVEVQTQVHDEVFESPKVREAISAVRKRRNF